MSEAFRDGALRRAENIGWAKLKSLVLDSLSSPHSKRAYEKALDDFQRWGVRTEVAGFSKATVQAYRAALEASGLAASSINVRMSALRKLASEASDNGALAADVAAAVSRVKGVPHLGVRAGNWLTRDQAEQLLGLPDRSTNKGKRDRALLLAGPPGTAKSMLSEWLAAGISGTSRLIVQGSSGISEDHVKYSWNYALLIKEGPTDRALKPSPILEAMQGARIARIEEGRR